MSLCKVCNLSDWESTEFLSTLDQLNLSFGRQYKHRKHWEFVQGILGLKRLGCLTPDALALGVGAGHEHPIYYLANYIKRVHATDIYGGGEFAEHKQYSPGQPTAAIDCSTAWPSSGEASI